jgi:hypothetical protein
MRTVTSIYMCSFNLVAQSYFFSILQGKNNVNVILRTVFLIIDIGSFHRYITSVLKVETGTITSITSRPIGRALILVTVYVGIIKTDVFCFICFISHNGFNVTLTDNFQYHIQFINNDNITWVRDKRKKCQ